MNKTGNGITGKFAVAGKAPIVMLRFPENSGPGMRTALRVGAGVCALMLTICAPFSFDVTTGHLAPKSAYAGNGDGNFGKGKGNGGPNEQDPGNGGGNNGGNGKDNGDGDGNGSGDETDTTPVIPGTGDEGADSGADDAAELADDEFSEAVDVVGDNPVGTPPASLPTISQLFSLGDEATVSAEEELQLISNGWRSN